MTNLGKHFNTSYVVVQPTDKEPLTDRKLNFNTSYVVVQLLLF